MRAEIAPGHWPDRGHRTVPRARRCSRSGRGTGRARPDSGAGRRAGHARRVVGWAPSSTGAPPRWRPTLVHQRRAAREHAFVWHGRASLATGAGAPRCDARGRGPRPAEHRRRPMPRWRTSSRDAAPGSRPSPTCGRTAALRRDRHRPADRRARGAGGPSPRRRASRRRAAGDDALIVYTSGTTGKPKGAVHTHASLLAGVEALLTAWAWEPEDRLILSLPLFHVHGSVRRPLRVPGRRRLGHRLRSFRRGSGPRRGIVEHHVLRSADDVPPARRGSRRRGALGSLRLCVSGSAPLAADLWHRLAAAGVHVLERYGMTETLLTLSNPLDGRTAPGLGRRAVARCRGGDRGRRRARRRGVARTRPVLCAAATGAGTGRSRRRRLVRHGRPRLGGATTGTSPSGAGAPTSSSPGGTTSIRPRSRRSWPATPALREVAVVGLPSAEWGETVVAFVVGEPGLEPAVAARRRRGGAGTVQMPTRGALRRRTAAQCTGEGPAQGAPLTGARLAGPEDPERRLRRLG